MTSEVFIDIETFSPIKIQHGVHRYAEHPDADLLMLAWAVGDGPVRQWVPCESNGMPNSLEAIFDDPRALLHAWNAEFEMTCLAQILPLLGCGVIPCLDDPERWYCDMAHAQALSLPASLDAAGTVVNLPPDKQKQAHGRSLIRTFCVPRKPTALHPNTRWMPKDKPVEWEAFKEYNRQDVEAERAVYRKLQRWPLSGKEKEVWDLNHRVNDTGLPIDHVMTRTAIRLAEDAKVDILTDMHHLTGVDNPNSVAQLKDWLKDQGEPMPSLNKNRIEHALETRTDLDPSVRKVLTLRRAVAKTSTAKYQALSNCVSGDDRLRGCFQYAGAGRTSRWTGRMFQPHNLPRGTLNVSDLTTANGFLRQGDPANMLPLLFGDVMPVLSSCIRTAVRAESDKQIVVADYHAIENVVLGWLSQCKGINDIYANGLDPYKTFGARMFNKDYDTITKEERTLAKPPVLGCGYMLGGGTEVKDKDDIPTKTGLWGYAESMGIDMSRDQSHDAVILWRSMYEEVPAMWDELDRAMRECIRTKLPCLALRSFIRFSYDAPFLRVRLPSGRHLSYCRPGIEMKIPPWEIDKPNPKKRKTVTYEGLGQSSRKWSRQTTHPGKITENIIQAIARDVLAEGLLQAERLNLNIIGHVHDEIILESKYPKVNLDHLVAAMEKPIRWAPGLHVKATGFISPFYRKD